MFFYSLKLDSCVVQNQTFQTFDHVFLIFFFPAQLLCKSHHGGVSEKDCDLLQAAHQRQRGDHVRLQVPYRGWEDPLFVRGRELQGHAELTSASGFPDTHRFHTSTCGRGGTEQERFYFGMSEATCESSG